MKAHATHDLEALGCLGCGLEPDAFDLIAPCANSRCPRCAGLVGCCRCDERGPRVGEEFVFMAAQPDAWGEWTETIADVLGRIADQTWRVEVGHARQPKVPAVFAERYGESFGAPRMETHHVVFFDGRWWHASEAEQERARRLTMQECAP